MSGELNFWVDEFFDGEEIIQQKENKCVKYFVFWINISSRTQSYVDKYREYFYFWSVYKGRCWNNLKHNKN